jgi:arabinogalactan oligomer/maltooligosaccharide transport system permease protein
MHLAAALIQVVLWHAYRAGEEQAIDQAVAAYNREAIARGVEVRSVPVPFDAYNQKRASAIPHGNGPDLFIAAHDGLGSWRRDGLVQPLRAQPAATEFLPGTLSPLGGDGQFFGLPLGWKSLALFYRTDLVPAPPRTTDELFGSVHDRYALAYETGNFYYQAVWLHAFGGEIMATVGNQRRPKLATQEGEKAIEWVQTQAARGRIPGDASGATATQLFRDGRAAATLGGPWLLGELPGTVPYAIAPLPIVSETGRPALPLRSIEGVFLAAGAKQPEEAERFARWLASDGALIRATVGRQLVAARAAWDDPRVAGDRALAAFRAQLDATVSQASDPTMGAVWEPAQEALRKALRGDLSPRAALLAADRRITLALAPPPPPVSATPYLVALALLAVALIAWLARRRPDPGAERGGGLAPWAYLSPALVCLVTLVFVPFAVGAGMSLFHHVPGPNGGNYVFVGLDNFVRLLGSRDQGLFDPLSFYFTLVVTILWTVVNVAFHVVLGVTLALLLRDPLLRLRGVYRVLLIVPWAMPSYITGMVWRGMFHRQFGAINAFLGLFGIAPVAWFDHFFTAFAANVTTNVWLGFPFMMVVTLGALARIPREVEEAAILDGATGWQRLRWVVLPLLRPALMPSIVLGAVWTFNMFNVVYLVSKGEPDGGTEILISQAYKWAFADGRGQQYGYAAAYAVVIFILLWAQSRLSRRLTEVPT